MVAAEVYGVASRRRVPGTGTLPLGWARLFARAADEIDGESAKCNGGGWWFAAVGANDGLCAVVAEAGHVEMGSVTTPTMTICRRAASQPIYPKSRGG